MKIKYQSKETIEYLKRIKQHEDITSGVGSVMIPTSLNNEELDKYVADRSGEVVSYKLVEVQG